jgi:hypothetical protein
VGTVSLSTIQLNFGESGMANIRPKNIETTPGSRRNTLLHIDMRNNFLSRTQKAQHLRERMNKWDCIKLKSFSTAKETVTRLKTQPTEREKIFASY